MKRIYLLLTILCPWVLSASCLSQTKIQNLRVQHSIEPIAVEDEDPCFSWQMVSNANAQYQKAYQISVSESLSGNIVWDSGKVDDDASQNIRYSGKTLKPETDYSWSVKVWDRKGGVYSASSHFATGLIVSGWEGAQWIGSTENVLSAPSDYYFAIHTDFLIEKGKAFSLVFGANDFRLNKAFQNIENMQGENYVRVEIDLSGMGTEKGAVLNIYRVGYSRNDKADIPLISISKADYPETNINDLLTTENRNDSHSIDIQVETSNMYVSIDGKGLLTQTAKNDQEKQRGSQLTVGQWGNSGDYLTYPNLCNVGFAVMPESKVTLTGYSIRNCGQSEDAIVFDKQHYDIFHQLPGVTLKDDSIILENDSHTMKLGYADPSNGALTMLRTTFRTRVGKNIASAKIYLSAMGAYDMYVNGKRISNDWFAPGNSQYREVLGYNAYDITSLVKDGENAMGALLIPAWYTGFQTFAASNFNFWGDHEALLAKMVITYSDGSRQTIVTDPQTWKKYNDGPWRYGCFYNGEWYDATCEDAIHGWTDARYNDAKWPQAEVIPVRSWIHQRIEARYDSPVGMREVLTAKEVMPTHSEDGTTYTYNMGVNMVGVPEITIPEGWLQKGDTVIIRYAEQVYPGKEGDDAYYVKRFGSEGENIAGRILQANMRAALVTDFYIANDSREVRYMPRTTYQGYQYIQITLPHHQGCLPLENVKGVVLSSDPLPTGTYHAETYDGKTGELVNQLFSNIQRSQLGNFFTIPTDCPQRNERMGWTGDAQAFTRTATYNQDEYNFFRQWMRSLRADQGQGSDTEMAGGIGAAVPEYSRERSREFLECTTWSAAICMVPWQLYSQYGDKQIIEDNLDAMVLWLDGMAHYPLSNKYPHLSSKTGGLADWLSMDNLTPSELVNNAIYIYMTKVTAIMARAINRTDIADRLEARYELAKKEWNECYVDHATGKTRNSDGKIVHAQSSYATPLNFDIFSEENLAKAQEWLAELSRNPSESGDGSQSFPRYTITTGFSGTPNILPALSRAGKAKDAYSMFTCKDYTSWLYPVTYGATSIWERWNGYEAAFGEEDHNHMNSFNHFALGAVGQWMYEYQLGITSGKEAGYKDFVLQPTSAAPYKSLKGSYSSDYGEIKSSWTADENGEMTMYETTVPANTTATLYLPIKAKKYKSAKGAAYKGQTMHLQTEVAEYRLASGTYRFVICGEELKVISSSSTTPMKY